MTRDNGHITVFPTSTSTMSTIIPNVGALRSCAVEMGIVGTSIFAVGVMAYAYYQKRKRKQIQKKYSVQDNSPPQNSNVIEITEVKKRPKLKKDVVQDNSATQNLNATEMAEVTKTPKSKKVAKPKKKVPKKVKVSASVHEKLTPAERKLKRSCSQERETPIETSFTRLNANRLVNSAPISRQKPIRSELAATETDEPVPESLTSSEEQVNQTIPRPQQLICDSADDPTAEFFRPQPVADMILETPHYVENPRPAVDFQSYHGGRTQFLGELYSSFEIFCHNIFMSNLTIQFR